MRRAAGVLPVSLDHDNHLVMLLGQERRRPGWPDQLKWSGFGGRAERGDKHIEHTAAREAAEESMYFLGRPVEIRSAIKRDAVLTVDNGHYCEYWLAVPYDAHMPVHFARVFDYLKPCSRSRDSRGKGAIASCPKGWLEKIAVRWVRPTEVLSDKRWRHRLRPAFLRSLHGAQSHLHQVRHQLLLRTMPTHQASLRSTNEESDE